LVRRETFHTSPHFSHRQYVSAPGLFAVVVIADEPHAGHVEGRAAAPPAAAAAASARESNAISFSIDPPQRPCGHVSTHSDGMPAIARTVPIASR
jgi:hypothetical protein